MDILCLCDEVANHNCIKRHQIKCCGAKSEKTCVANFINTLSWCLYCGEKSNPIEDQLYLLPIPSSQLGATEYKNFKFQCGGVQWLQVGNFCQWS